jgi:hypothetical protein
MQHRVAIREQQVGIMSISDQKAQKPLTLAIPELLRYARDNGAREIAITFGVLLIAAVLFPEAASIFSVSPNPLWLLVVFFAAQRGSFGGLLTALGATIVHLSIGVSARTGLEDTYEYWLRILWEPALWIATAGILGELTNRKVRDREAIADELALAERHLGTIIESYNLLRDEKSRLERIIALAEDRSFGAGIEAIYDLSSLPTETIGAALSAALRRCGGVSDFRILAANGSVLLEYKSDADGGLQARVVAEPDEWALLAHVKRTRRVMSVRLTVDLPALNGKAVMAVPVADSAASGNVIAVLLVDDIEPAYVSRRTEIALLSLAGALPDILARLAPQISQPVADASIGSATGPRRHLTVAHSARAGAVGTE